MESAAMVINLRVGVGKYLSGKGSISCTVDEINRLGGRPFVIGGSRSVKVVQANINGKLEDFGIHPVIRTHLAQCTREFAATYAKEARENNCTVIVGIGGGKCLDLAKATATVASMDLICLPTSAATCVATSSVCIMYNDDGTPDGSLQMDKCPDVVIADPAVIGTAPKRTLAAGIMDSVAKLPEVIHNQSINTYLDCPLTKYICMINSKAIYNFLISEGQKVYHLGDKSERFEDVILTNLLHTSVVSSFSLGVDQLALAHGFYSFMRKYFTQISLEFLHGEIVGIGVLVQMRYNGAEECEIRKVMNLMAHMKMPIFLEEVGFESNESNIQELVAYLSDASDLNSNQATMLLHAVCSTFKVKEDEAVN